MVSYQVLTACAACGLLVRAQEVALAPILSSARLPLRQVSRLQSADHPGTRETRTHDDLAVPQAHALG